MSTVSALLRTVVCFRVCVWDSISNADGIAGGNALPHARACVKQTTNLDTIEVRNTSCPCLLDHAALSSSRPWGGGAPWHIVCGV